LAPDDATPKADRPALGTELRRYYHPLVKHSVQFLETSAESGGERTLLEVEVETEGGPPPHYHRSYDEHFEVVEGTLIVELDETTHTLGPGETAIAPRNSRHRFDNLTEEPVTFRAELRPGQPGFERMQQVVFGLAADTRTFPDGTPKNPYHLALLVEWWDTRVSGVASVLEPVLRFLAKRARKNGVEERPVAEYCG
jgi:quercetin dioxygenase-like cupin family protein